jgi:hypothetical protein
MNHPTRLPLSASPAPTLLKAAPTRGPKAVIAFLLLTLLVFTGCLEGGAVRTGRLLPANPPGTPVDVYLDANPAVPWEEIGRVYGEGTHSSASLPAVLRVLEDQTNELGADAVLVTDHWVEEEVWVDRYGVSHVERRVFAEGIAIAYLR